MKVGQAEPRQARGLAPLDRAAAARMLLMTLVASKARILMIMRRLQLLASLAIS